jgi:hypothetical protein
VQIAVEHPFRHLHVNPLVREVRHDHADLVNRTDDRMRSVISIHELRQFVIAVADDDRRGVVGVDVLHQLRQVIVAPDELEQFVRLTVHDDRGRSPMLHTRSALPTREWPGGMRPSTAALPAEEM